MGIKRLATPSSNRTLRKTKPHQHKTYKIQHCIHATLNSSCLSPQLVKLPFPDIETFFVETSQLGIRLDDSSQFFFAYDVFEVFESCNWN